MFPLLGAGTLKLSILQVNLLFVYEDKCIPTVVTLKISNLKMDILQMYEDFKVKIFELKVDFPNVCTYIKVFPQLGLGVNN